MLAHAYARQSDAWSTVAATRACCLFQPGHSAARARACRYYDKTLARLREQARKAGAAPPLLGALPRPMNAAAVCAAAQPLAPRHWHSDAHCGPNGPCCCCAARAVGLAYSTQVVPEVPVGAYDMQVRGGMGWAGRSSGACCRCRGGAPVRMPCAPCSEHGRRLAPLRPTRRWHRLCRWTSWSRPKRCTTSERGRPPTDDGLKPWLLEATLHPLATVVLGRTP